MRLIGRVLSWGVVLAIVAGITFYERPLWVDLQMTHTRLLWNHVQSDYVLTPEGKIHYYDAEPRFAPGHGMPLVLVHGLGDRDESWVPMIIRLKKAGFHVYAPDLLGYGRSPKPVDSDYSIATQEKVVSDFIQAIGLQKPDIGGWSMGGWIVLKLATDHPEMVDRVVVYDSAGVMPKEPIPSDAFKPLDVAGMRRLVSLLDPSPKPLPEFVAKDALRVFRAQQWVVDKGLASMNTGRDLVDHQLPQLQNPLLIVWGSEDHMLPLSMGQTMHSLDPRSELDIVEGCGHLAPKTCAGRVSQATADFLKAEPAPGGSVRTLTSMNK